ncbi:MAG: hypothetical protein L6R42_007907 [Xanthoria sp. 1 TBL-2021]|nr:MAG: hypothetical protein L6R42_007907 [Xanthoria sp. 1 TBL-2021]
MALMVRPGFRPPRHFLPPVHLHLYSFGITIGTPTLSLPVLLGIDLRDLIAPPQALCYWFTGKDPEIQAAFWSFREHERIYRDFVLKLQDRVMSLPPGVPRAWAVLVNCKVGVHRSVAFVRRLHDELRAWPMVTVDKTHLWFGRAVDLRRRRWERERRPY